MTFKYPYDQGGDPDCKTRLIEDGDKYHIAFEGDNAPANDYRDARKTDGSKGYGPTKELREVGFVSNSEALFIYQMTGINLFSGDKTHTEAFLKLLNGTDFSRLKTFDGNVSNKVVK